MESITVTASSVQCRDDEDKRTTVAIAVALTLTDKSSKSIVFWRTAASVQNIVLNE
jgi:hypothetical protein